MAGLLLLAIALAGIPAALAGLPSEAPGVHPGGDRAPGTLSLRLMDSPLFELGLAKYTVAGRLDRDKLASALRRRVPSLRTVRRGRARITYRLDRARAVRDALALGRTGGRVDVAARALSAQVAAPVVRQRLRNNCESAALQILLATTGVRVDQLQLQREFRRDGPLDPEGSGAERIWGDPDLGYVGRPEGGGVAGGFGVYPRPVAAVARRHGRALDDLSGGPVSRVYQRLREGRAVMAWVGLSDGPSDAWRSPRGRTISVNFGEHTVVLTGLRADGLIRVVNPLKGTRELWSQQRLQTMWARLGQRALGT